MTEISDGVIIESEGVETVSDTIAQVLESDEAAAGIVRLDRPPLSPGLDWHEFCDSYHRQGFDDEMINYLWGIETRPTLSSVLPLDEVHKGAQDSWAKLQLQGTVVKPVFLGKPADEASRPHHDSPGIIYDYSGSLICRTAVLSYNNDLPAELRATRGPLTANPDNNIFELRDRINKVQAAQLAKPATFNELPVGVAIEPYDLVIIPSLPHSALHAVKSTSQDRKSLLYDLRVTQELDI